MAWAFAKGHLDMVDMDDSLSMDWRGERRPRGRCIVGNLRAPRRIARVGSDLCVPPPPGPTLEFSRYASTREMPSMSRCRYCNASAYGGCPTSPHKKHEHVADDRSCEFCGSSAYGGCPNSPSKKHRHGHGNNKCVWCGSTAIGGCAYSPNRVHEK